MAKKLFYIFIFVILHKSSKILKAFFAFVYSYFSVCRVDKLFGKSIGESTAA